MVMMNSFLILLFTFVMTQATYLRAPQEARAAEPKSLNKLEDDQAQQQQIQDVRPFYTEHYSPELRILLNNPRLMQELYDAVQQSQQLESDYKQVAPSKRAQTFVRFGKRSQTFVRFGRR